MIPPTEREPFCKKSSWMPPKNRVPVLEAYTQVVSSETNQSNSPLRRTHDNLPRDERTALSSLMSRSDIIIKPADKGSAVVIQDRQDYIKEAMRHLSNSDIYTLLDSDPTDIFSQQIKQTITDMYQRNQISKKAVLSFLPQTVRQPGFISCPKFTSLVTLINSYIHDTPDFLRKLEDIKNQIPSTAIIGTFDVTSLYTNIPHAEGIAATCAALSKKVHPCPPISDIKALMQQVLTKNNFTFMDKHYLQRHGTAMGTRMAPSYACLFMSSLEERMLSTAPCRPLIWWRYIDDIFFIWTSDEDSLLTFINHINSFHSTIKFTSDYSHQQVNFLDVTVRKEHGSPLQTYTPSPQTHTSISILQAAIPVTASLELPTVKHFVFVAFALTIPLSFAIQMLWKNTLLPGAIVPEGCVKPFRESAPFPDHLLWQ
ncbi:hypothetical protein BSL78_06699 [Apostichopus japonicus]|uniref:Reverse transcriptase domain-containing protein n=1 Tax=Stichopus japonicus TaxID=307972 RepID=A0A2G8L825_STIJA|nr:hypothetical protein BSL78_06699 [Apostichopus japonicus]